jgi:peptidoglycan/xylan/chitin deacetylase (PgdA/CDA1 family)
VRRALAGVVAGALALVGCGGSGDHTGSTAAKNTSRTTTAAKRAATFVPATGTYRGPVPILMYHVVSAPPPGVAYAELWTPRETFKATIALLVHSGYRGVTLGQVWRAWHGGPGLPRHSVVVSFDDGYLSQFTHAKPALRLFGWPAVLNLEGKNVGPGGLTQKQVRTMIAAGWEVDSHTLTHPDLTTLDDAALRRELQGSRALLRRDFGVPVDFFCYPAGRYNSRVEAAVRAAGYKAATTVDPGLASAGDDPYALPRIRVNGGDSPETVLAHVRSGAASAGSGGG